MDVQNEAGVVSLVTIVVDKAIENEVREHVDRAQLPSYVQLARHSVDSEQQRQEGHLARRADHLLSAAIFFIAGNLEALVTMYLAWTNDCGKVLALEQIKPLAYLCCPNSNFTSKYFFELCMQRDEAGFRDFKELLTDSFQEPLNLPKRPGLDSLFHELEAAAKMGRRQRIAQGHLWGTEELTLIRDAFIRHFSAELPAPFSVASTLTRAHPDLGFQSTFARVLLLGVSKESAAEIVVPLMASYLAHHARGSRHWSNWPTSASPYRSSFQRCHFARHHFNQQYRIPILSLWILCRPILKLAERSRLTDRVFDDWCANLGRQVSGPAHLSEINFELHLRNLESKAPFLISRDFGYGCLSCLAPDWDTPLPCLRHGFCNACLRLVDIHWRDTCQARVQRCPICRSNFPHYSTPVRPAAARGRVLALDGGGVCGLFQLKILDMLESEIGLDIPVQNFFDLVVGTSIGGINALGLCVNGWSIRDCREMLEQLSTEVFTPTTRLAKAISFLTGGWSNVVHNAVKVYLHGGMYHSEALKRVLQKCFSADSLLLAPLPTPAKVAVTATASGCSPCKLLTSYKMRPNHKESPYSWWQSPRSLKVWEAARATSAAPFYFPSAKLDGTSVYDGAVYCPNPSSVGRQEASKMFGGEAKDCIAVSVGCGNVDMLPRGENMFGMLWDAFSYKTSPAKEEQGRLLWAGEDSNYMRLDARLNSEPIALDNIEMALWLLRSSTRSFLDEDALRTTIQQCAWRLIAATFFADLPTRSLPPDGHEYFAVSVYCRLEGLVQKLYQKWPDTHFVVNGVHMLETQPELPHVLFINSSSPSCTLDIELAASGHKSSISGFPTLFDDLKKQLYSATTLGPGEVRKRKSGRISES